MTIGRLAQLSILVALLGTPELLAQTTAPDGATEPGVRQLLARFDATASEAGKLEARARSALFSNDAVVINAWGSRVEGRAAVDSFWLELYNSPLFAEAQIDRLERRQQVLAPGLVLVDHVERLTGQRLPRSGRVLPPRVTHITLILRRDGSAPGGNWRILYYRAGDVRARAERTASPAVVRRAPGAGSPGGSRRATTV